MVVDRRPCEPARDAATDPLFVGDGVAAAGGWVEFTGSAKVAKGCTMLLLLLLLPTSGGAWDAGGTSKGDR